MPTPEEQAGFDAYWEERARRLDQRSQDIDDGLYDDTLGAIHERGVRHITSQLPDGYAYDLDESQLVRFDVALPNEVIIKNEFGKSRPVPTARVVLPAELRADPDRYQTRTEPLPEPQCKYWKEHMRRVKQIWEDYENGLHANLIDPLTEETFRYLTDQLPDGYAYDRRRTQIVRLDPNLPRTIRIKNDGVNALPWNTPTVITPEEAEADPDRYQTRTWVEDAHA